MVWCGMVWYVMVWYGMVWYGMYMYILYTYVYIYMIMSVVIHMRCDMSHTVNFSRHQILGMNLTQS